MNTVPPNPDYGTGIYRRRIRLAPSPGRIAAELEDCNHGFRAVITHDGHVVTGIDGDSPRVPMTTCPEALAPLQRLVGVEVNHTASELNAIAGPRSNCTHWLDLTVLAINHILRDEGVRQYDVEVTDEVEGISELRVYLNGALIHDWRARAFDLLGPGDLSGRPLLRGFAAWAGEVFEGDQREAAFVLHKGNFVAQARRHHPLAGLGRRPSEHGMGPVCYSYSPGNVERAEHCEDSVRDFTDTPEQLLRFV